MKRVIIVIASVLIIIGGCGKPISPKDSFVIDQSDDELEVENEKEANAWSENLVEYPYSEASKESGGITFTDNADGTITVNGTAAESTSFYFVLPNTENSNVSNYDNGIYYMTGGISNECMMIFCYRDGNGKNLNDNQVDSGKGAAFVIDPDASEYSQLSIELYIREGASFENVTISPSLRMIDIPE